MSTAAVPAEGLETRRRRARVLVVDDDPCIRELVKLHLGNHGYQVIVAEDAVEAGHAILRDPPHLIIVDVQMPYMNGYELVAALKAEPTTRHMPVVFLTTDADVAEHAKKLGAEAYLNKPVSADKLLAVVSLWT